VTPGTINVSRFAQTVRALFGIRGDNPVPNVEPTIQTVIVLEEEREERGFAAGEVYFGGHVSVGAGGAGNRTEIMFRNPPGSGVLAIVHALESNANLLIGWQDGSGTAGFSAPSGVTHAIDRRFGDLTGPIGTVEVRTKNVGVASAIRELGVAFLNTTGGVSIGRRRVIAIVPPGSALIIMASADNVAVFASWLYRERPLERGLPS